MIFNSPVLEMNVAVFFISSWQPYSLVCNGGGWPYLLPSVTVEGTSLEDMFGSLVFLTAGTGWRWRQPELSVHVCVQPVVASAQSYQDDSGVHAAAGDNRPYLTWSG